MRVLLTGASGFVGSHVLRHLLSETDWQIICPVSFRHRGLPARIASSTCGYPDTQRRVTILHWDMLSAADKLTRHAIGEVDVIYNIASESHVDRSIDQPVPFINNNIQLILNVLELARRVRPWLFLQMSTDEVYGPAYEDHRHREWEPALPSNPYSASKAAQEAIAISYWRTYGIPVVITNTMNIIGEMQDPEKFLPMIIRSLRDGKQIPVHTAPDGTPGSRLYLHARNLADAWLWLTQWYAGVNNVARYSLGAYRPDRFNIVGEREIGNAELVGLVGGIMGVGLEQLSRLTRPVSFHSSRPGHDLRYALNGRKLAQLGWRAPVPFDDGLARTVKWTLEHPEWLL